MNEKQIQAAQENMLKWLADPHELGKMPHKIELAGEFDLHGLHYCIFRFKPGLLSKWIVGVSGGFEEDDLEPCGHTFSDMKEFRAETAQNDCMEMVEKIRAYWMEQAKKYAQQQ
ncbi:MAG: hypothetical protein J6P48_03595 [Oscillospiraceae bacterium]|nr:hypothetical protein [Oscillospiraceae bacterium]